MIVRFSAIDTRAFISSNGLIESPVPTSDPSSSVPDELIKAMCDAVQGLQYEVSTTEL